LVVAGGRDSGVFLSTDGGANWHLLTDPFNSDTSGKPNLPRPSFAYFDHTGANEVDVYIGTQGRGVWRFHVKLPVSAAANAVGSAQAEDAAIGVALGLTIANHTTEATLSRDLTAAGAVTLSASSSSDSTASAKASAAGAPGDASGGGHPSDGTSSGVTGQVG